MIRVANACAAGFKEPVPAWPNPAYEFLPEKAIIEAGDHVHDGEKWVPIHFSWVGKPVSKANVVIRKKKAEPVADGGRGRTKNLVMLDERTVADTGPAFRPRGQIPAGALARLNPGIIFNRR